ncbi:sulfur-oxidizing protein SoxY [Breoghania corrubedonensis]|uniref:Sulfur-oxidizing protein SoxY n=2 Tax=Breoghania corrubedonensis TaxID=665038 RepID=A0A2T5VE12_9HYPH|nr:sulfur-oxidizing protein SoxY [Breoghania corrubedonensis]
MRRASTARLGLAMTFMLAVALLGAVFPHAAHAAEDAWTDIRAAVFGDREIADGAGVIALETPYRAHDAAVVPISVTALIPQTTERYIAKLTLIIDENPAPVVGTFGFFPENGIASLSTRVRVNAYTNIRAVAETSDGRLFMVANYVKAAGGCSAPAGKDHATAMARLGQMRMRQIGDWHAGEPAQAQFMVSHPNYSGMQTDQVTQLWIPADYVRTIELSMNGKPILTFDGDISMSENPSVRFFVKPKEGEKLTAHVTDTEERSFSQSWNVKLEPGS